MFRRKQASESPERDIAVLNKPGIIVPKPGRFSSFCFHTVLFLLAWAGAFGCFLTAFDIPVDRNQFALWSVFFSLLCAGQYWFERRRWIMPLCTLLAWGIALWRFFEPVTQGALRTANIMLSAYSKQLNVRTALPQFPVEELFPGTAEHVITVFLLFLAFLFFCVLSWMFVRHQSLLGSFALTGLFLLSHLGFSILPNRWAFGLLLVFWAFLLLAAPSARQRDQLVERGSSFHSAGNMFLHPISLVLLPILALSMLLIYTVFPPETYERPKFFNDLRTQLNNSLNLQTVFRGGGTGYRDRVDFSALGSRYYTEKVALQVRHEWQNGVPDYEQSPVSQKDFLKSFVGSVYTGTSWERLPSKDAKLVKDIWGDRNVQTLPADLMQFMPMDSDPHFSYFVFVRKPGADSQIVYSPYGLYSPLDAPNNMKYEDDGFLTASGTFSGVEEYALSAVATPSLENLPTYKDRIGAYMADRVQSGSLVLQESSPDAETIAKRIKKSLYTSSDGDQWRMPGWMRELLSAGVLSEVIDPMERYSDFVYSRYTQIPDGLLSFLTGFAEEHELPLSVAQEDWVSYLGQVKRLLAEEYTYSWTPPVVPEGGDFVTYFLKESRTGYCVHFATAATMLLRAAGIPARYAEGFAVPTGQGSWVDVPDYNAHAWVEVYWGGIGWIPIDMTPAGDSVPAAYANAASPSENDTLGNPLGTLGATPTPSASPDPSGDSVLTPSLPPLPIGPAFTPEADRRNSPSPSPSPSPRPASQSGGGFFPTGLSVFGVELLNDGQKPTFFGFLFLLLLLLLVPLLLIWGQRLLRLLHRKRLFRQRNRNKAALCVYAHLLRLYREDGLLPGGSPDPPEEIEELALKARFSNHTLTEEYFGTLTGRAAELEKKIKAGLPRGEGLRCKYLRVLF